MKKNNFKKFFIVLGICSIVFLVKLSFFPKKLVHHSIASVRYETVQQIVDTSDVIVEVEISDDLKNQNSVLNYSKENPTQLIDFYSIRKGKVINIIKGKSLIENKETLDFVEPVAIHQNNIFELDVYPYHQSLKKGQQVTLFLEKMNHGLLSIKQVGNAQINHQRPHFYHDLLDIYLNGTSSLKSIVAKAVPTNEIMEFKNNLKHETIETKQGTYSVSYHELNSNQSWYLDINNINYISELKDK